MTINRINRDEDAIEALETDLLAFAQTVRQLESKLRIKASANVDTFSMAD